MVEYGAGPALNEENDFIVDSTGDLQSTIQQRGEAEEIEKDLAFNAQIELQGQLGRSVRPSTAAVIRNRIEQVASNNSAIERVLRLNVREIPNGYEVELTVQVVDEDTDIDLVFELN